MPFLFDARREEFRAVCHEERPLFWRVFALEIYFRFTAIARAVVINGYHL